MKCKIFALSTLILFIFLKNVRGQSQYTDISLSDIQMVNLAKVFLDKGDLPASKSLLLKKSFMIKELEIERLFLIGRIFALEKDYDNAIEIFDFILENDPTASKVRFELAVMYMKTNSWYSADYHLRRVATDENLPQYMNQDINKMLYIVRKNKNLNFSFSLGYAPDNNINNARGGEECVITLFGVVCRKLPDAERAIGFNISASGTYEIKFNDELKLKNIISLNNIKYDNKKFDNTFASISSGPKFIYNRGEVYLSIMTGHRWVAHHQYNYSTGLQLDLNHDFSKNLYGNFNILYNQYFYYEYKFLNGSIRSVSSSLSYNITPFISFTLKMDREIENTKSKEYKNRSKSFAFGVNTDLYYGFSIYAEPSINIQKYYHSRVFVKNFHFTDIMEQNKTQKYQFAISNKKLNLYKLMPVFRYWYIKRTSNVEQNAYEKRLFDITITRKF